jgi:hypothetical protein
MITIRGNLSIFIRAMTHSDIVSDEISFKNTVEYLKSPNFDRFVAGINNIEMCFIMLGIGSTLSMISLLIDTLYKFIYFI